MSTSGRSTTPRTTRWGDDHIVIEYTADYPLHAGMVVVVHFDAEVVSAARTRILRQPGLLARYPDGSYAGVPGATMI